ncbi:unnamed protein product [Leptosia nina]|uniref:Uncharacterized protein n=1 Tax=Leptosia nina TaxID=320188 RepID=A0AAV1J1W0_9NEOP
MSGNGIPRNCDQENDHKRREFLTSAHSLNYPAAEKENSSFFRFKNLQQKTNLSSRTIIKNVLNFTHSRIRDL